MSADTAVRRSTKGQSESPPGAPAVSRKTRIGSGKQRRKESRGGNWADEFGEPPLIPRGKKPVACADSRQLRPYNTQDGCDTEPSDVAGALPRHQ
jgi:hypothetical protein